MADVTINSLPNITPNLGGVIPISQGGSTYSTVLAQLSSLPFIPKAWVNFNGLTNTINSSFNIKNIVKNTTGDYTINFITPMTDANYSVNINSGRNDNGTPSNPRAITLYGLNTTSFSFVTFYINTSPSTPYFIQADDALVCCTVIK